MGRSFGTMENVYPACLIKLVRPSKVWEGTGKNVIGLARSAQPLDQLHFQPNIDPAAELDQIVVELSHNG